MTKEEAEAACRSGVLVVLARPNKPIITGVLKPVEGLNIHRGRACLWLVPPLSGRDGGRETGGPIWEDDLPYLSLAPDQSLS